MDNPVVNTQNAELLALAVATSCDIF